MSERWSLLGALPPGAEVTALALDGEVGVVGGQRREASPHAVPRAFLARVTAQEGWETFAAEGAVVAVSILESRAAAVLALPRPDGAGSQYSLLRSNDQGRHWELTGRLPYPSIEQVALGADGRVWLLGAHLLAVADGERFQSVELPGDRDITRERLIGRPGGIALLGPRTFLEERGQFREVTTGGLAVDGLEGSWIIGHDHAHARVGTLAHGAVSWKGTLPEGRQPLAIAVEGPVLRVLSRASAGEQGTDLAVHRSDDEGRTWTTFPLPLTEQTRIQGARSLGADLGGRLYGRL